MPDEEAKHAALERALEDDDSLVLLYQPIHDIKTREVYSAEALLRQRREDGQLREASIIHEAAEESCGPELFQLDNILVRKAYGEAAHWPTRVRLNVNLSPREFQEGNILDRLRTLISSCGMDPRRVNVEITETSYIDKPEETMDVLVALKKLGIGLWLDDFGTGHSAIAHLQHFPVDGIKLSGKFVQPLPDDRRCSAIVSHLIALAHDLDMRVIAEEVEREEQLDFLIDQGCDYLQGFLFSKPMMPERFIELLGDEL
jgi:EAL domain-containing protein (putative c-di-GMP-specific phosphodiesterase class I)